MLSNAVETRLGSLTGQWEHFFGWLRANDEKEKVDRKQIAETGTSLERLVKGLFQRSRLLDYVENFVLFHRETNKIIAQNHQFIGVNHALAQFEERNAKPAAQRGKLGVFWHTQGSGKSFSMVFYVRKIFRKLTGNFTFVVVTDRDDLDGQIYRNFLNTGTVKPADAAQPTNSEELRKFLGQKKRLVFTLIQKFRFAKGAKYPVLSERDDIVVIVDEAHRTQYKSLAENMRAGLPNASFLAFTGTPLLGRDRKTNECFGDYVSEYTSEGFTVKEFEAQYQVIKRGRTWDLSRIDFDKLRQDFGNTVYKNIGIADLRGFIARKLELMMAQNSTRGSFAQRFQSIIDNYNAGGSSTEQYFEQLVQFSQDIRTEDERHLREGLTEAELEIFDLLRKDAMTHDETQKVKLAARALLYRLQDELPKVLVQDWYKTDQTRLIVLCAVAEVLDRELPTQSYDRVLFQAKCNNVFHLVLDRAAQGRKWAS